MSGYYDDEPPRRHHSTRHARRPVYEEEAIEARGTRPSRQMDLIRRPRDASVDSLEYPTEVAYVQRRTNAVRDREIQRAHSVGRSRYHDDDYRRRDEGGRRSSRREERRSRHGKYESDSESVSPPRRERRKSLSEKAIEALGLGGAAAALTGRDNRSRSRRRKGSRSRSRSRSPDGSKKVQQAVKAALAAGAAEAYRSRKEPGGWAGQGKRVMTAAIGAAGVSSALTGNKENTDKHSTRETIGSTLGGLASSRLINGSRSRSRSRARGDRGKDDKGPGLGGLAAVGGLAALGAKAVSDYRNRHKDDGRDDRDRGRGGRGRDYSDDSRSPSPQRKRSKSVTEYLTRGLGAGMAKLGLSDHRDVGRGVDKIHGKLGLGESENHRPEYRKDRSGHRYDDEYSPRPRGGGHDDESAPDTHKGSGTDEYSSEEELRKQKKMRGKEMLTAGLASVATIHAAHSVYQSVEKRKQRHKKVLEGKMSPEEARKLKSQAILQDAASVGLAALGIKGAVSEWKEMKEQREVWHEARHRLEEKREHRRLKKEGKWPLTPDGGSSDRNFGQRNRNNSEPNLSRRDSEDSRYDYRNDYGPRYQDGNPYSAGPYPPPQFSGGRLPAPLRN